MIGQMDLDVLKSGNFNARPNIVRTRKIPLASLTKAGIVIQSSIRIDDFCRVRSRKRKAVARIHKVGSTQLKTMSLDGEVETLTDIGYIVDHEQNV